MYRSAPKSLGQKGQTTTKSVKFTAKDLDKIKKIKNPCNEWKRNNTLN